MTNEEKYDQSMIRSLVEAVRGLQELPASVARLDSESHQTKRDVAEIKDTINRISDRLGESTRTNWQPILALISIMMTVGGGAAFLVWRDTDRNSTNLSQFINAAQASHQRIDNALDVVFQSGWTDSEQRAYEESDREHERAQGQQLLSEVRLIEEGLRREIGALLDAPSVRVEQLERDLAAAEAALSAVVLDVRECKATDTHVTGRLDVLSDWADSAREVLAEHGAQLSGKRPAGEW